MFRLVRATFQKKLFLIVLLALVAVGGGGATLAIRAHAAANPATPARYCTQQVETNGTNYQPVCGYSSTADEIRAVTKGRVSPKGNSRQEILAAFAADTTYQQAVAQYRAALAAARTKSTGSIGGKAVLLPSVQWWQIPNAISIVYWNPNYSGGSMALWSAAGVGCGMIKPDGGVATYQVSFNSWWNNNVRSYLNNPDMGCQYTTLYAQPGTAGPDGHTSWDWGENYEGPLFNGHVESMWFMDDCNNYHNCV